MNFQNIKKTVYLLFCTAILFIVVSGCSNNIQSTANSEKTVIEGNASFVAFSIRDLAEEAYTIVRGTIVSKGEPFEVRFGPDTVPATPITIKVTQWIKGDKNSDIVIYNQLGGETDKHIMKPLFTPLSLSDDVIICLLPDGLDYGPDGIFIIQDGKAKVRDYQILDNVSFGSEETSMINVNDLISEFVKELK